MRARPGERADLLVASDGQDPFVREQIAVARRPAASGTPGSPTARVAASLGRAPSNVKIVPPCRTV